MEDDLDLGLGELYPKPPSPPPPAPTFSHYHRPASLRRSPDDWEELRIRLVGSHPLWGHHLWNAARCFAVFLDENSSELCVGKKVLELGAGGGLPGIVAALCGARKVLLTDYPDEELVQNMRTNVEANIPVEARKATDVQGYIWGRSVTDLLSSVGSANNGFDLILMSDLIFNHSQHDALLQTAESCLVHSASGASSSSSSSRTPCVLAFYTHHRPHLAERDLGFFTKARARGWICEEIVTERFEPMFPEDSGDETVRSVVHGWRLTRGYDPRE